MTRQNASHPIRDVQDMTEDGPGRWVPADEVPPFLNVSGRLFRTKDGKVHRYYGPGFHYSDRPYEWFFPAKIEDAEVVDLTPPDRRGPPMWAVLAGVVVMVLIVWGMMA